MAGLAVSPLRSLGASVAARTARATPLTPVVLTSTGRHSPASLGPGGLHGSLRPSRIRYSPASGLAGGDVLLVGQESAATSCADGGRFHTFDARGLRAGRPLQLLDSVVPAENTAAITRGLGSGCSAHWFSQQGQLVAASWFGAGLRILDLSDPRRVRQVGRYVPTGPRTWSRRSSCGTYLLQVMGRGALVRSRPEATDELGGSC